jgi:hypothetical protein
VKYNGSRRGGTHRFKTSGKAGRICLTLCYPLCQGKPEGKGAQDDGVLLSQWSG